MRHILVTTDSSPVSNHAVRHAQALAGALSASLTILAIEPDLIMPVATTFGLGYVPPISEDEIKAAAQQFRADLQAAFPGQPVRIEQAQGRAIHEIILDVAQAEHANLIVMSTHGRSGLGRALLGSVAEAVVHQASVPVLLIKGDQTPVDWTGGAA